MLPLRAYLAAVDGESTLAVEVHRDLGSLLDSWQVWQGRGAKAIVDVGFSRLSDCELLRILDRQDGRVLLSRPARDVFARVGRCAARPADQSLDGVPYFVAISGWGYEIPDPASENVGYELGAHARAADEVAQPANDVAVDTALLTGRTAADLVLLAGSAPAWAADAPIDDERLALTSAKHLRRRGIHTLRALADTSPGSVELIPWMGPARIAAACNSIRDLIFADRMNAAATLTPTAGLPKANSETREASNPPLFRLNSGTLIDEFDSWIGTLKVRDREILSARAGRRGASETLDAIAETTGVSREGVRWITSRKVAIWSERLQESLPWTGLVDWVRTSGEAPWLDVAAREVPWLQGTEFLPDFVRCMFDGFEGIGLNLVEIEGRFAITAFSQHEWRQEEPVFRRLIRAAVDEVMPLDLLRAALIGAASELPGPAIGWAVDVILSKVILAQPADGPALVVGVTATGESIARKVLVESTMPLHFSEIHRRAIQQGFEIELRRVHSAAATVGYLFDRGTYGILKHTGLSTAQLDEYRRKLEDTISKGRSDLQWHSHDLFGLVEAPDGNVADDYLVDIVLEDSNNVADLGRRVWASRLGSHRSAADRIDKDQAVESLLRTAGTPMTTKAIQAALEVHRGIGKHFQIHEVGKLVRTGVSQWGLIDRDVPLSEEEMRGYLASLTNTLNATHLGVHKSELASLVPETAGSASALSADMLMSVATRTGDFRGTQSEFVILPDWDGHNRVTVSDAVGALLADRPASTKDLLDDARVKVGLDVPMYAVHAALKHLGAVFDQTANAWSVRSYV